MSIILGMYIAVKVFTALALVGVGVLIGYLIFKINDKRKE